MSTRSTLASLIVRAERVVDRRLSDYFRSRPGWGPVVSPYVSYGTTSQVHIRARVLLMRRDVDPTRPGRGLMAGLTHFLSVEIPDEAVSITVAGHVRNANAGPEGYVEVTLSLPDLEPGWHSVTFTLTREPNYSTVGRLLVVDPAARLGVVSDIDDTIIHTGLTRLLAAVRTTLFVPEHGRTEITGASQFYRGLVAGAGGHAQFFYVSTGAWNLHAVLQRFMARHGFPEGPLLMTDWGPSGAWMFREASVAFKARVISRLIDEYPSLTWVLIGDSGQDDPAAYAAVAHVHGNQLHAVYIRDVPPRSPVRTREVRRLTTELADAGVTLLLVPDHAVAADHAHSIGLIDSESRDAVRAAVDGPSATAPPSG